MPVCKSTSVRVFRGWAIVAFVLTIALLIVPGALGQEGADRPGDPVPASFLLFVGLWGAVGGVAYELISLQGSVEWPHRATQHDVPDEGFPHAYYRFLFDFGIVARIFLGAAAALAIYMVLPLPAEGEVVKLIATSIVAGSVATAIFESLQNKLLAKVNAAKAERLADGIEGFQGEVTSLQETAEMQSNELAQGTAVSALSTEATPARLQAKAARIQGRAEALLKLAGRS